jgi:hypothetical protein
MVREIIRLDADMKPLEAINQVYETHTIPEMVGEVDYDSMPSNRFKFSYFGIMRARLLALWDAGKLSGPHLGSMLGAISSANINSDPFSDEAVEEASDETVIEMITQLGSVTTFLQSVNVKWNTPFDDIETYFDENATTHFGTHLTSAVGKLRNDVVSMLDEQQLDAYSALGQFFMNSPDGVAIH